MKIHLDKINGILCSRCNFILISETRHDFVSCECGNFADGGQAYLRRGGKLEEMAELRDLIKGGMIVGRN